LKISALSNVTPRRYREDGSRICSNSINRAIIFLFVVKVCARLYGVVIKAYAVITAKNIIRLFMSPNFPPKPQPKYGGLLLFWYLLNLKKK
jgi:ABC-type phosphate transport system permease subunit